jgi:hypothetical protein
MKMSQYFILSLIATLLTLQSQAQGLSQAQSCKDLFRTENIVQIRKNQIVVDGVPQPNLYGAEFQYFRLRGGYGKNIPREKVLALWNRGLDEMVAAGMNTISFYIPWDFHEYAPGKFDFTGTVDQDGDGHADYPSRDILTFLKLVEAKGIKKILLRPGPYINAEWGYLGFGAIPEWFHDQYPDSHMRDSRGFKTKLFDYHNEDFLRHTKLWFEELNKQVLVHVIGKDKPGIFLQLDNETNFQWQSIYNHDYGAGATARYQSYMKNRYGNLTAINQAQNITARTWSEVTPPKTRGQNITQDRDWYRFQDKSIFDYLKKVKQIWYDVGVREPNVIFTLAESFNAAPDGLLPNYRDRNSKKTGLMTINVYPKTWADQDPSKPAVLHYPFKSTYDILAAASANKRYLGRKQEAVIGPEIHTGWFNPTVVSDEARQQTYLTLLGRGMKAMYFYYFNEGDNSQVEWGKNKITPYFDALARDPRYSNYSKDQLPDSFWSELQYTVDSEFMVGWPVKHVLSQDSIAAQKLHFGAPLDGEAQTTEHYELIQKIGLKIIKPFGEFLSRTVSLTDAVALIADANSLTPSQIKGVDSRQLHSDFAGGLIGYILQAGLNPSIHHWGINSVKDLAKNKIIFVQDSGNLDPKLMTWLAQYIANGGTVVNFLGDSLAQKINAPQAIETSTFAGPLQATYQSKIFDVLGSSVSDYQIQPNGPAVPILLSGNKVIGYSYSFQKGQLIQLGAIIHDAFNSDAYAHLTDVPARRKILDDLVIQNKIPSFFRIKEGGDRIDVFGRKAPNDNRLWLTVKSGQLDQTSFHVVVNDKLVSARVMYQIKNVLTDEVQNILGAMLTSQGFSVQLGPNGSSAFLISPAL